VVSAPAHGAGGPITGDGEGEGGAEDAPVLYAQHADPIEPLAEDSSGGGGFGEDEDGLYAPSSDFNPFDSFGSDAES
jgi:hypothetical protein